MVTMVADARQVRDEVPVLVSLRLFLPETWIGDPMSTLPDPNQVTIIQSAKVALADIRKLTAEAASRTALKAKAEKTNNPRPQTLR